MINISNNRATFSYEGDRSIKDFRRQDESKHGKIGTDGIPIDPDYEPSIILEHLVDVNRWPSRLFNKKPKTNQSLEGMDRAESNYEKPKIEDHSKRLGKPVSVVVFWAGKLYEFKSIGKASEKFRWVRWIFKKESPHTNNELRWAMRTCDYDPENLVIRQYKDPEQGPDVIWNGIRYVMSMLHYVPRKRTTWMNHGRENG